MAGKVCAECCQPSSTVRLCLLDGYDTIRASFALPLSEADHDVICGMEDRGGGEMYRAALCRTCRAREVE